MKLLATVLGAVLLVLTPLAYGSPVDPSTPGFWDDGDYDDVVLFLTSDLHLLDTAHRSSVHASDTLSAEVSEHPARVGAQRAYAPGTPRAPPDAGGAAG